MFKPTGVTLFGMPLYIDDLGYPEKLVDRRLKNITTELSNKLCFTPRTEEQIQAEINDLFRTRESRWSLFKRFVKG